MLLAELLLPWLSQLPFIYIAQACLPKDGTTHGGLDPQASVIKQENIHIDEPTGQLNEGKSPTELSSSQVGQIDNQDEPWVEECHHMQFKLLWEVTTNDWLSLDRKGPAPCPSC